MTTTAATKSTTITLANGDDLEIVFTARHMGAMEDKYGSLDGWIDAWGRGTNGPVFETIAWTLGQLLRTPPDKAFDLIDAGSWFDYVMAFEAAYREARGFPPREVETAEAPA